MQESQLSSGGSNVSSLSHELRGDLNSILLALQVLRLELSHVPNAKASLDELDRLRESVLDTVKKIDAVGRGKNPSAPRPDHAPLSSVATGTGGIDAAASSS